MFKKCAVPNEEALHALSFYHIICRFYKAKFKHEKCMSPAVRQNILLLIIPELIANTVLLIKLFLTVVTKF